MMSGLAGRAAELKSQGALEAARDPNSSVDAEAAEQTVLREARAVGAPAFEFNPDASPEEKAQQMKQAGSQRPHRKHPTATLVSDQDDGQTAGYALPEASKAGAVAAADAPVDGEVQRNPEDMDQFSKVGWAPRFGALGDKVDEEGSMLDHATLLETRLDDKYFGDWYHNAAIIVFACLASWTVAILGGGLGWVFLVMTACGTYYRTSIRRVRRNFRDDIRREEAMTKLETDTETLEWINSFLVKFWPIYAPVLCTTIIQSVDQVLSTATPAFLDSMRLKSFTLGTKPPRLEHVKTYPKANDDIVLMDWKFSFTPNDVADLTARQIKNKINPKIVLEVRIGKAMISKGMDIIVEDMACEGTMRVKMKLQLPFPHIERVEICFLGRPKFDYVCKPIGGDMLGFDINFIPGLESFIQEQIHANLAPMMYDPNVFPIEIAKMLAGTAVDQAIGVLQVTFHGAAGLKNPDKFSGTPDPYATVSINNRDVLAKTKTVPENASPRWNETVNIILSSLREPLTIQVWDYNDMRKDKSLGVCTFNLDQLEAQPQHENLQLEVIASGRARGVVQADIRFFPVLEGQKMEDGTVIPPPESSTGIAKFTVEQAKDLDGSKSLIGALNPYAVLLLNGKEVQVSKKLKRTNNPIWPDASKDILITDRKRAKLGVVIKDDRDLAADPILGTYQIKVDDMLDLMSKGQEWYNIAGAKTGRVKMMLQWKPVALKGAMGSGGGYVTPIGVMRFYMKSAKDLKNAEAFGKSDPYARILLSGIEAARTLTFQNNLSPEWDEVFYIPVHSTREKLVVEVMDEETTGKDRTLGQLEVSAADYVKELREGQYAPCDTKNKMIAAPLRIGSGTPKGTLNFSVAFYPCLNVADPEEVEEEKKKAAETSSVQTDPKAHPKADDKADSKAAAAEAQAQALAETEAPAGPPKIRIGPEDVAHYGSGLMVLQLLEAQLAHTGTYLEVLVDDKVFPSHTTAKARKQTQTFNETGDVMIREIDTSRITLRLVDKIDKKGTDGDENVEAKFVGPALDLLRKALYTPTPISLKDKSGRESRVTVSARYLPVQMDLDPSESINNSGNLRVDVIDGADLPAADRNGFSDPFCKFQLNGKDVYKTKTQKKTLQPVWNESFEVTVPSRTAARFQVTAFDWDFGDKADLLGVGVINLAQLEPLTPQEVVVPLDGKSGTIRLRMIFTPSFVSRARQGTASLNGALGAPVKVIGAPVKGVGKGAALVGGSVAKGAGFLGRGFKRRTVSGAPGQDELDGTSSVVDPEMPALATGGGVAPSVETAHKELPSTPSGHQRTHSSGNASGVPGGAEVGTATITVVSASGFDGDPKLEVHIQQDTGKGPKDVMKTDHIKQKNGAVNYENESKKVQCAADCQFRVVVVDHKTFGSDKLGEAPFFINDQAAGGEQMVQVGNGSVVLRTSFLPAEVGSVMAGSESPASQRKGGLGRFVSRRDRSVTPGAG